MKNKHIELPARVFSELTEAERVSAITAFKQAHGSMAELNFAPDRAWIEGFAYAEALESAGSASQQRVLAEQAVPVEWQYRWTNPGNNPSAHTDDLAWKPLEPRGSETMQQRVAEIEHYEYEGKPCYEVRALGVFAAPVAQPARKPRAFENTESLRQYGEREEITEDEDATEQAEAPDHAYWFALVQGAASEIENAAVFVHDPVAKRVALSGAEHYRAKAKEANRRGNHD